MGRVYYKQEYLDEVAKWAGQNSICAAVLKFGVSDPAIRRAMIRLNIPRRRPGNYDTYAPADRIKAINLRLRKRKSLDEIQTLTGIPKYYITRLVCDHKKKLRELAATG